MEHISDAVVRIGSRTADGDDADIDEDVRALEWLAHLLHRTNLSEKNALAAAAERAAEAAPDCEKKVFQTWMEDMFGEHWHDSGPT